MHEIFLRKLVFHSRRKSLKNPKVSDSSSIQQTLSCALKRDIFWRVLSEDKTGMRAFHNKSHKYLLKKYKINIKSF